MAFVILDASQNNVLSMFGMAQNPPTPPGYAEIPDNDPRIAMFQQRITARADYEAAINTGGIVVTWTVSTALNDTYPVDLPTQVRLAVEFISLSNNNKFTGGGQTTTWYGSTGTPHTFTVANARAFGPAMWQYITAVWVAYNTALAGGPINFPSNQITVTG